MTGRRSHQRSAQVVYRMTPEKREELKRLADEAGVTVQAYMDRAVFPEDTHVHDTTRERGLPMTG